MRPLLFLGFIMLTVLAACSKDASHPGLIGNWRLVATSYGPSGPVFNLSADSMLFLNLHGDLSYEEESKGQITASGVYEIAPLPVNGRPVTCIIFDNRKDFASSISFHGDTLNLTFLGNTTGGPNTAKYVKN